VRPVEREYARRDDRRVRVLVGGTPIDGTSLVYLAADPTDTSRAPQKR